jgi:hypothetical protein
MDLIIASSLFDRVDWRVVIGNDNWYIVVAFFYYGS